MKKQLIIITLFMLNAALAKAQDPTFPPPGTNFPNPSLDQFVGTWSWTNGSDTLKIKLKKVNYLDMAGYTRDALIGYHYYKKAGTLIESSFTHINSAYTEYKHTLLLSNTSGQGDSVLTGGMDDLTKNKSFSIRLDVNLVQHTMAMKITEVSGVRVNTPTPYVFTIPNNITLTKQ